MFLFAFKSSENLFVFQEMTLSAFNCVFYLKENILLQLSGVCDKNTAHELQSLLSCRCRTYRIGLDLGCDRCLVFREEHSVS